MGEGVRLVEASEARRLDYCRAAYALAQVRGLVFDAVTVDGGGVTTPKCYSCGRGVTARARYCSSACRQKAYRKRRA